MFYSTRRPPQDRYSLIQEAIGDGHAETCRNYNGTGHPVTPSVAGQVTIEIGE